MFSDLVHIELIRLIRTRFFLAGIFALLAALFFMNITYPASVSDAFLRRDLVETDASDTGVKIQVTMYMINSGMITLFATVNVTFATCDYYKYREFINIRGSIRSRAKLCLSEISGILIQCLVLSLIPVLMSVFSRAYDELSLITAYPFATVILYLSYSWTLFNSCLVMYAVSKLLRRKSFALPAEPVIFFCITMVTGYLSGFLAGRYGGQGDELARALFVPSQNIAEQLLGNGRTGAALFSVAFAFLQTGVLCGVSILFGKRAEKI